MAALRRRGREAAFVACRDAKTPSSISVHATLRWASSLQIELPLQQLARFDFAEVWETGRSNLREKTRPVKQKPKGESQRFTLVLLSVKRICNGKETATRMRKFR